ncbi:MAG: transposase [Myxococcota bacterium]
MRIEEVPWARHGSWFTDRLEELVAYLVQVTDKTTVTRLMGISWEAVDGIVRRIVHDRLMPERLDGLQRIGIDEFSYRKRHRYITVVVDHDTQRVVWASEGRGADTLGRFFDALGEERVAQLKIVTMDMAGGYKKAVRERAPHVQVVFDRFHVQRLASDAVERVRRSLWRVGGVPSADPPRLHVGMPR